MSFVSVLKFSASIIHILCLHSVSHSSLWGFSCIRVRFLLRPQHLILCISTALLSTRPLGGFYPLLCISLVLSLSCAICFSSHLCSCSFLSFLYFGSRISIGFFFFSFNSLLKFSIFHLCLEHIAHILRFLLTMAMSGDAWICVYCLFWVYRDPVSWHSWGSWLCGGHCQENREALAVFCCSEFLFLLSIQWGWAHSWMPPGFGRPCLPASRALPFRVKPKSGVFSGTLLGKS